jgi:hypothetical protein
MKLTKSKPLVHFLGSDAHLGFLDRIFIKNESKEPGLNERMFHEDFSQLFHYSNRRDANLFDLTTNDEGLTERLLANVKTQYGPHGIDATVREWAEEISTTLVWENRAYYYLWEDLASDELRISSFGPNGVSTLLGLTFQWVPRHTHRHWDRDNEKKPREIRLLERSKILRFKMPRTLRQMLRAQNRTLATIDRHQYGITSLYPQATHEDPNPTQHFDFSVWRDTQDIALYRSTQRTGWSGRKYDGSKRSDFFDCHRLIRFRRNQLILRDDILKQLGSELTRVGKQFNAKYGVTIKASKQLPSIEQLNDLEARLKDETVAFSELVDFCYKA